jgi:hypothetical protein
MNKIIRINRPNINKDIESNKLRLSRRIKLNKIYKNIKDEQFGITDLQKYINIDKIQIEDEEPLLINEDITDVNYLDKLDKKEINDNLLNEKLQLQLNQEELDFLDKKLTNEQLKDKELIKNRNNKKKEILRKYYNRINNDINIYSKFNVRKLENESDLEYYKRISKLRVPVINTQELLINKKNDIINKFKKYLFVLSKNMNLVDEIVNEKYFYEKIGFVRMLNIIQKIKLFDDELKKKYNTVTKYNFIQFCEKFNLKYNTIDDEVQIIKLSNYVNNKFNNQNTSFSTINETDNNDVTNNNDEINNDDDDYIINPEEFNELINSLEIKYKTIDEIKDDKKDEKIDEIKDEIKDEKIDEKPKLKPKKPKQKPKQEKLDKIELKKLLVAFNSTKTPLEKKNDIYNLIYNQMKFSEEKKLNFNKIFYTNNNIFKRVNYDENLDDIYNLINN